MDYSKFGISGQSEADVVIAICAMVGTAAAIAAAFFTAWQLMVARRTRWDALLPRPVVTLETGANKILGSQVKLVFVMTNMGAGPACNVKAWCRVAYYDDSMIPRREEWVSEHVKLMPKEHDFRVPVLGNQVERTFRLFDLPPPIPAEFIVVLVYRLEFEDVFGRKMEYADFTSGLASSGLNVESRFRSFF